MSCRFWWTLNFSVSTTGSSSHFPHFQQPKNVLLRCTHILCVCFSPLYSFSLVSLILACMGCWVFLTLLPQLGKVIVNPEPLLWNTCNPVQVAVFQVFYIGIFLIALCLFHRLWWSPIVYICPSVEVKNSGFGTFSTIDCWTTVVKGRRNGCTLSSFS